MMAVVEVILLTLSNPALSEGMGEGLSMIKIMVVRGGRSGPQCVDQYLRSSGSGIGIGIIGGGGSGGGSYDNDNDGNFDFFSGPHFPTCQDFLTLATVLPKLLAMDLPLIRSTIPD